MEKKPSKKISSIKRRKKTSSIKVGLSFWIALIVLICLVLVFGQDRFSKAMSKNKFISKLNGTEKALVVEDIKMPGNEKGTAFDDKNIQQKDVQSDSVQDTIIKLGDREIKDKEKDVVQDKAKKKQNEEVGKTVRDSALYFVFISDNGDIKLNKITRKVEVADSPLQSVISVLLQGLSDEELNQGNLSLIPDGTKLRNISVSNGVATMDFSEEFMFNTFGNEGMLTQLRQVVYTATEFPTVKSVQFLIEGKRQEFIAEGIYVGAPMARNSF